MSDALQIPDSGPDTAVSGVHSQISRYDGSRTPPEVQYEIMRRHKDHLPLSVIGEQVGCDPRTVKAVIENWGTSQHRMRLEAHRGQLVDALILSWGEAAKRGKSDSLLASSHALGITEPPKAGNLTQVAVQVNLHGGPEPLSLANTEAKSETLVEQAHSGVSLIMEPMITAQVIDPAPVTAPVAEKSVARQKPAKKAQKRA